MKKWLKYVGIAAGIVLFVFLMLPFLEPPSLNNQTQEAAEQTAAAKPQIFTSNPLTDIVRRVARLFSNQSAAKASKQRAQTQQAAQLAAANSRYAANVPAAEAAPAAGLNGISVDPDQENAQYFLPENAEAWALTRQRSPENASGMHEISLKDSPYEQLMKRERVARYVPASVKNKTEVPDSKLARMFAPIKRFFGFGDGQNASDNLALAAARGTQASDALTTNRKKQASNLPQALDVHNALDGFRSTGPGGLTSGQLPSATRGMNSREVIDKYAKMAADSLQINTNSARGKSEYERALQEMTEQYEKAVKENILKDLEDAEEPSDVIANTLENLDCGDAGDGLLGTSRACSEPTPEEIAQLGQQNAQIFAQETKSKLPSSVMASLSIAELNSNTIASTDEKPSTFATSEMYDFMLKNEKCEGKGSCLWMARNITDTENPLLQTIQGAGMQLAGDPLGKEAQMREQFQKYYEEKLKKEQENQSTPLSDKEIKKQAEKVAQKANPAYLVYNEADLKALIEQAKKDPQNATPLYFSDRRDAKAFFDKFGYTVELPVFYGRDHMAFSLSSQDDQATTTAQAAVPAAQQEESSVFNLSGSQGQQNPTPLIPIRVNQQGTDNDLQARATQLTQDLIHSKQVRDGANKGVVENASTIALTNTISAKMTMLPLQKEQQEIYQAFEKFHQLQQNRAKNIIRKDLED